MKDEISESNKIHFAVMALEASSRKMNISPMEMYQRLKRVDLFKRLVLDCYDVMHTQSLIGKNKTNSTDKFFLHLPYCKYTKSIGRNSYLCRVFLKKVL